MSSSAGHFLSDSPTYRVMMREFKRIKERKATYILMIIIPLVVFFLITYIYRDRVVVGIPVGVCDLDNSEISRTIVRSIESTRSLKIAQSMTSIEEISDALKCGEIQGAFYIPANLEKDIKEGKPATFVIYKNTTNLIIGNLILKDASTISQMISAGVLLKKLKAGGLSQEQAMVLANPIRIDSYPLFNPGYSYLNFLPPALVMVMFQMLIMIAAVVVINNEIHEGTLADLFHTADCKIFPIIFGKFFAHLAIHCATGLGALGLLFPLFGIPIQGSILICIPFMLIFIAASFFPGMAVSAAFQDKFIATDIAAFYNSPAFLLSGYTFPLWAMPGLHHVYALLLPFTHFLNGFLKIYQYDAPISSLLPEISILSIFIIVPLVVTAVFLAYRVKPLVNSNLSLSEVES